MLSSVQFSHSVVSDSLRPHEPQDTRPPCPSPIPRVHPNPCPLCQSCHPTISSSVVPFSSHPQSFPASGFFQMSQLSTSGVAGIGVSASASVPPMNTQERPLISWLQSPSAEILEPTQNKVCHCFHCFPIYLPWSSGTGCHDLSFWMSSFKPTFSLSSFTFINRLFSSSSLHIWVLGSIWI